MRALRLASALLLALASCVVDTDDLKPKSEAECADQGLKVCGYKCIAMDDPATGCGELQCTACPAGVPGAIVYCDPDLFCAWKPPCPAGQDYCDGIWDTVCDDFQTSASHCGRCGNACTTYCDAGQCAIRNPCPTGQAYCDGPADVVCDDLLASPVNCGACAHACATCNAGLCTPIVAPVRGRPLDIDHDGTGAELYWLEEDPVVSGAGGLHRLTDLDLGILTPWVGGLGAVDRLLVTTSDLFVSQSRVGGAVWKIVGGSPSAHYTPGGVVRAMALDQFFLYVTESGPNPADLVNAPRDTGAPFSYEFVGAGGLAGVATLQPIGTGTDRIVVGTESGALQWVAYDLSTSGFYATGIATPVQIAVYRGDIGGDGIQRTIAFWITQGGNVSGKVLPDGNVISFTTWTEVPGGTARMDIMADAHGMVWSDGLHGVVAEWRALQDDVLVLAEGQSPGGVTATQDGVFWTDTVARELRVVPR